TELQEQADAALYEAKRRGRNRLVIFDESLAGTIFLPSMKAAALRHLLQDRQMCIVFQPIWDLSGKRLLAVEALARPDAKYGFAGPQEMFDIAEKMDLVAELDRVCQRAIFAQAHMIPADVQLFINVCPASLEQLTVSDETILKALHAANLTPQRVVIEVTERAVHQLDTVVSEIERLRKLGFGIALDDTGAGNAGLEMLSSLAVDYVKIDRGILVKAMTDRAARGVLAGIIAIAQETNSYVIAEGIENVEMFEMTLHIGEMPKQHRMGVRGVQGYLFGRPSMSIPTQVPDLIAEPQQQAA
ncbi:MAG TPA: GGDEF domain-containing phosphodiesterase, partial [Ktedonobacterales bacterium]|nr:GGDEF domain-containing phosphodiesterase [Ktedonobacterales bacterium]